MRCRTPTSTKERKESFAAPIDQIEALENKPLTPRDDVGPCVHHELSSHRPIQMVDERLFVTQVKGCSLNFFSQDIWYAVRQLRKNQGFTAATVLTLALGIGANLTVFLILYGVLLRPLPFPHPQQLVRIERAYPDGKVTPALPGTKALFIARTNRSLEAVAAYDFIPENANLIQGRDAVPVKLLGVTSDFFRVFQMEPRMGRGFNTQDEVGNAAGVAVISDALWRQRFAANPHILGRPVTIGTKSYSIIGIVPPLFRLDSKVDVWAPLHLVESPTDQSNQWNVVARLRPGVTYAQAADDLKRIQIAFKGTYPALWSQYETLAPLNYHDSLVGNVKPAIEMLMGAVTLLLVIVSANILCLLLTRSIARRQEMSLRVALGATSWRILRQLLVENAILCIVGGVAGVALANFGAPFLMQLSPLELPHFSSLGISAPALAFAAGLTLVCAIVFSLVPAVESSRRRLGGSLRANATQVQTGRNLAQKALVVSEVGVSLLLMVVASLLLTNFWKLIHTPPGFQTANVLTFKNAFSEQQVATSALLGQRLNQLAERLEAIPGVASAAAVNSLPTQIAPDLPFQILGHPKDESPGSPEYMPITAHYFDALRIPTIAGRTFLPLDTHGSAPVVIINQQVARTAFKGQNPIGQHILIGAVMGPDFKDSIREVVGVVGDVKEWGLDKDPPGIMYLPAAQIPDNLTQMGAHLLGMSWVVRTKSAQTDVAAAAQRVFMDNAQAPLLSVEPLDQVVSASIAQQRFSMILLCGFGLISLVLGAAGLYGVMSYTVARRTKEIGVRMAIGAQRSDILQMVLREAGMLVGLGLIVGVFSSLAGAQLLRSMIAGTHSQTLLVLASMSAVLLLTGLFAAGLPARRAAAIEPMQALRIE